MSHRKLPPLAALSLIIIMLAFSPILPSTTSPSGSSSSPSNPLGLQTGIIAESNWWDAAFLYRYNFTFTEPGYAARVNTPTSVFIGFEQGRCYNGSIRVTRWDGVEWHMVPFQLWNITYYSSTAFVKGASLTFDVNVSRGGSTTYYVYYTRSNMGAEPSYPNYYPFVYYSFVLTNISLRGVYDNTNYRIEKYVSSSWRVVKQGSLDAKGSIHNGTASTVKNARAYGVYRVRTTKPVQVVAGSLEGNLNNKANDWALVPDIMGRPTGTYYEVSPFSGSLDDPYWRIWILALENDTTVSVTDATGSPLGGTWRDNTWAVTTNPAAIDAGEYITRGSIGHGVYLTINASKPVIVYAGTTDAGWSDDIWTFVPSEDNDFAGSSFLFVSAAGNSYGFAVTNVGDQSTTITATKSDGTVYYTQVLAPGVTYFRTLSGGTSEASALPVVEVTSSSADVIIGTGYVSGVNYGDSGDFVPSVSGHRVGTAFTFQIVPKNYRSQVIVFAYERVQVSSNFGGTQSYVLNAGQFHTEYISGTVNPATITTNGSVSVLLINNAWSSSYTPTGDFGVAYYSHPWTQEASDNALITEQGILQQMNVFRVTVTDLSGLPVASANVTVYYACNGSAVYDEQGNKQTGVTDANGFIEFAGLLDTTYRISSWIDVDTQEGGWLNTAEASYLVWANTTRSPSGFITQFTILQPLANVSIHLTDLDADPLTNTAGETVQVEAYTLDGTPSGTRIDSKTVNSIGNITFYRLPASNYSFFMTYTNPTTGVTYSSSIGTLPTYNYTIQAASSFNISLPLSTLSVNVASYDDSQPVIGATVNITQPDVATYIQVTNSSGSLTFYRIRNGTWNLQITKTDNYGQTAENASVNVDLQQRTIFEINLPLTRLIVRIDKVGDPNTHYEGATIRLNRTSDNTIVATGISNASGYFTFFGLKAGQEYRIMVTLDDNVNNNHTITPTISNWTIVMAIEIQTPSFEDSASALFLVNSTNQFNVYYGDVFRINVHYFNITSLGDGFLEDLITYDSSTYVNFIIHAGSPTGPIIGTLYWTTSTSVNVAGDLASQYFNASFSTIALHLNASTLYFINITAHTDTFADPVSVLCYLTVLETPSEIITPTGITYEWVSSTPQYFTYLDTQHDTVIDDATVATYSIIGTIYTGDLVNLSNGSYQLDSSILNQLAVGDYLLSITLQHYNYANHTTLVGLHVTLVSTTCSIVDEPVTLIWGSGSCTVNSTYRYGNGTQIDPSTVTITVRWIPFGSSGTSFSTVISSYNYSFVSDLVSNGTWRLEFTFNRANFVTQTVNTTWFVIRSASMTAEITSEPVVEVEWQEEATYTLTLNRTDLGTPINDAIIYTHNWTDAIRLYSLGSGTYRVSVGSSIPAVNQTIQIGLYRANYNLTWVTVEIRIFIPLYLANNVVLNGSEEDPLNFYWTQTTNFTLTLYDRSRPGVTVSEALVNYYWPDALTTGSLVENVSSLGQYYFPIIAQLAAPNSYTITVNATKTGHTMDDIILYLIIRNATSHLVVLEQPTGSHYEDVLTWRVYWENTIDFQPIVSPDFASLPLYQGPTYLRNVTALTDLGNGTYVITVDSLSEGLAAFEAYQLSLELWRSGYVEASTSFAAFTLAPVNTRLSSSLSISTIEQGKTSSLLLTVAYDRNSTGVGIENASITANFNNVVYTLVANGDQGVYQAVLPTTDLAIAAYEIEITAGKSNFVSQTDSLILVVEEPSLFELPFFGKVRVSTVFFLGSGITLPLLGLASVVTVKRARMPYALKVVNNALRHMMRGTNVPVEKLQVPARATSIRRILEADYAVIGLTPDLFELMNAEEDIPPASQIIHD